LIAAFAGKFGKMPPDRIASGDAHRQADAQALHGGEKVVDVAAAPAAAPPRLRCAGDAGDG
jgi:hypothetical protein